MATSQDDIKSQLKALCRDMRERIEQLTPHDVAEAALERLDGIELGIFGEIATDE